MDVRARLPAQRGRPALWARSLLSPRQRLLPGVGARLSRRPALAARVLGSLRRVPGRRVRASVARNVTRPLVERMTLELEVPVREGFRMRVETADVHGRTLLAAGVWEPQVTAAFHALLAPGDVCVDVGANLGYFSLLASRLVGAEGHVFAIEPAPSTFERLRGNIALNRSTNVTLLPVAAGVAAGTAVLVQDWPGNAGASFIDRGGRPLTFTPGRPTAMSVRVRPVHELVEHVEPERIRLIKIDVEGYEREVLTGIEALFQRGAAPSVIVEMHPGRHDRDAGSFVVDFCLRHALRLFELRKPSGGADLGLRLRGRPPLRDVPDRHCTLLLSRP